MALFDQFQFRELFIFSFTAMNKFPCSDRFSLTKKRFKEIIMQKKKVLDR